MIDHETIEETIEHYESQKQKLYQTINALKNRCIRLQNENRYLHKQNQSLIREKKKPQHYKNGKRGSKFNG